MEQKYVNLRRIEIDGGEILTPEQLPVGAVPTGRVNPFGFPEYVYGPRDLVQAYCVALTLKKKYITK